MDIPTPPITSPVSTTDNQQLIADKSSHLPISNRVLLEETIDSSTLTNAPKRPLCTNSDDEHQHLHENNHHPWSRPKKKYRHQPQSPPLTIQRHPTNTLQTFPVSPLCSSPLQHTISRNQSTSVNLLQSIPSSILINCIVNKYILQNKSNCSALARTCKLMYSLIVPYLWQDPFGLRDSPCMRLGGRFIGEDPIFKFLINDTLKLESLKAIQSLRITDENDPCEYPSMSDCVHYTQYAQYIKYIPSLCASHTWCQSAPTNVTLQIDLRQCLPNMHTKSTVQLPNVTSMIADFTCIKYRRLFTSTLWDKYLINPVCSNMLTHVHIEAAHAITNHWFEATKCGTEPSWPMLEELTLALSITQQCDKLVACIGAHSKSLAKLSLTITNAVPLPHLECLHKLGPLLVNCKSFHFVPADDSISPGPSMLNWIQGVLRGFPSSAYKHLEVYPITEYSRTHYFGDSLYPIATAVETIKVKTNPFDLLINKSVHESISTLSPPTPVPSPLLRNYHSNNLVTDNSTTSTSPSQDTIRIDRLTLWTPLIHDAWDFFVLPILKEWGHYTKILDVAPWTQNPRSGYFGSSPLKAFDEERGCMVSRLSCTVPGLETPADWGMKLQAYVPNLHTLHAYCLSISPTLDNISGLVAHKSLQYVHLGLCPPNTVDASPELIACMYAQTRTHAAYEKMFTRVLSMLHCRMKRVTWMSIERMPGEQCMVSDTLQDMYAQSMLTPFTKLIHVRALQNHVWAVCALSVQSIRFLCQDAP